MGKSAPGGRQDRPHGELRQARRQRERAVSIELRRWRLGRNPGLRLGRIVKHVRHRWSRLSATARVPQDSLAPTPPDPTLRGSRGLHLPKYRNSTTRGPGLPPPVRRCAATPYKHRFPPSALGRDPATRKALCVSLVNRVRAQSPPQRREASARRHTELAGASRKEGL